VLHSQLLNLPKEWTNKLKLKSHFAGKPLPVSSRLRQTFQLLFFLRNFKIQKQNCFVLECWSKYFAFENLPHFDAESGTALSLSL